MWCCGAELRLVSNTPGEGRLEIYHNGSWGTVCNDAFDDIDAQVACNSLGYGLLTVLNFFCYMANMPVVKFESCSNRGQIIHTLSLIHI